MSRQRLKRWCDAVLEVPQGYRQLVASVQQHVLATQHKNDQPPSAAGAAELLLLSRLESFSCQPHQHGDMESIKPVVAATEQLAAACTADSATWRRCSQLMLELLFLHSSRPLHKQLLSFLRRASPAHEQVLGQVVLGLVTREAADVLLAECRTQQQWKLLEEGGFPTAPVEQQQQQQQEQQEQEQEQDLHCVYKASAAAVLAAPVHLSPDSSTRGFDLAQALVSLLQLSVARAWLQPAASLLLLALARSVHSTLDPQAAAAAPQQQEQEQRQREQEQHEQQQHLTPRTAELVQDTINVMYMLLQAHGADMAAWAAPQAAPGTPDTVAAVAAAGTTAGTTAAAAASTTADTAPAEPPDTTAGSGFAAVDNEGLQGAVSAAAIYEAAHSMLCALQGSLTVREALASAAVVLWAAASLPPVCPTAAALVFAAGLLPQQLPSSVVAAAVGNAQQAAQNDNSSSCPANSTAASSSNGVSSTCTQLLQAWHSSSVLEQQLQQRGTSLAAELQRVPYASRVCALKGLLMAMPSAALAGHLGVLLPPARQQEELLLLPQMQQQQGQSVSLQQLQQEQQQSVTLQQQKQGEQAGSSSTGFSFVMQCALPFALEAVRAATDLHTKYFAVQLLVATLQGAAQLWALDLTQGGHLMLPAPAPAAAAGGAATATASAAATAAAADGASGACGICSSTPAEAAIGSEDANSNTTCFLLVAPWLSSRDASAVMSLLLSHMDDPVQQVLAKVQDAFEALLTLMQRQAGAAEQLAATRQLAAGAGNTGSGSSCVQHAQPAEAHPAATAAATGGANKAVVGEASNMLQTSCGHDAAHLLAATARAVLALGYTRKGRYAPLTALLPHIGALQLLHLQPSLVSETLLAIQSHLSASAAAGFFKALLLQLRTELPGGLNKTSQQGQVAAGPAAAAPVSSAAAAAAAGAAAAAAAAPGAASGVAAASVAPAAAGTDGSVQQLLLQYIPPSMRAWCSCWLPQLLSALWDQGERSRTYAANYALPMVLQAEPLLLQPMVDIILAAHAADTRATPSSSTSAPPAAAAAAAAGGRGAGGGDGAAAAAAAVVAALPAVGVAVRHHRNAAAALVVVLKTGRRLQLVGDLDILLPSADTQQQQQQQPQQQQQQQQQQLESCVNGGGVGRAAAPVAVSPASLLLSAVSSASPALRVETLELVCYSARTTSPPGVLELLVAQRWLSLCLRCTGADTRHKSLALWEKLLVRQASAVRALRHRAAVAHNPGATGGAHPKGLPRPPRNLLSATTNSTDHSTPTATSPTAGAAGAAECDAQAEQRQMQFLAWMSQTLLDSLYPGAPYERKYFALELMALLLQQWMRPTQHNNSSSSGGGGTARSTAQHATAQCGGGPAGRGSSCVPEPFLACLLSPACVEVLFGCVVDSWDKMRAAACRVLLLMPSPLPGCNSPQQLLPLLHWALQLLQSPRAPDSDAGAKTVQLLVRKYLLDLGWGITLSPQPAVVAADAALAEGGGGPVMQQGGATSNNSSNRSSGSSGSRGGSGSGSSGCLGPQQLSQAQAVVSLLGSVSDMLRAQLAFAQADMAAAARQGLVHGSLLCLSHVVNVLPWTSLAGSSRVVTLQTSAAAAAAVTGLSVEPVTAAAAVAGAATAATHAAATTAASDTETDAATATDASGSGSSSSSSKRVLVRGAAPTVLQCWVTDLVGLLEQVAELVGPLLSAQDINIAANDVEEADADEGFELDDDLLAEAEAEADVTTGTATAAAGTATAAAAAATTSQLSGPVVQLLISTCWQSWKEASTLIGTLACHLPLPSSSSSSTSSSTSSSSSRSCVEAAATPGQSNHAERHPDLDDQKPQQKQGQPQQQQQEKQQQGRMWRPLISCQQLDKLGSLQLSSLLTMRHNGATEKSQAGFIALLERLLQSPVQALNSLPRVWLGRCISKVLQPGQCRDDIVRRSAGLPFALRCLFVAEPPGVLKVLLPSGLQQLLDIATNTRLEEPWPRVHAFNVLRLVFSDGAMASHSSSFQAAGVVAAINGMTAPAWEVRNSASLAFTALVMRVVGARNLDTRQQKLLKPLNQLAATPSKLHMSSSSGSSGSSGGGWLLGSSSNSASLGLQSNLQGPTAVDFFKRFPQLHAFLLQTLQNALRHQQQQQQGSGDTPADSSSAVPPGLFPVLVLLSRLRPLLLTSTTGTAAATDGDTNHSNSSQRPQGLDKAGAAAAGTAAAGVSAPSVPAAVGVAEDALDPALLVPTVLAVGQSAVMAVRAVAAAALAPLVPAEQLHVICLQLASLLPPAAAATAAGAAASDVIGAGCSLTQNQTATQDDSSKLNSCVVTWQVNQQQQQQQQQQGLGDNALHGVLLQLTALLAAVSSSSSDQASNPSSCAAAASLVQQLLPAFVRSSWLAAGQTHMPGGSSSSSRSCAVRQAYVTAAGQLLVLAYKQWPRLQDQIDLLEHLVDDLHGSCMTAVLSTVAPAAAPCTAATATATATAESARLACITRDCLDPSYSCWLRDCTALLLGPLLQMQLLLYAHHRQHDYSTHTLPGGDTCSHSAGNNSGSSSTAGAVQAACLHAEVLELQLQLLAQLLPLALSSRSYEVVASGLKACNVQLQRLSALLLQDPGLSLVSLSGSGQDLLHASSSSSSSSSSVAESLHILCAAVWEASEQQQVPKVTKRLWTVWGQLQQLQQAFAGLLDASLQQQQQAQHKGAVSGLSAPQQQQQHLQQQQQQQPSWHAEQLQRLVAAANSCRDFDAKAAALLCAARAVACVVEALLARSGSSSSCGGSRGSSSVARPAAAEAAGAMPVLQAFVCQLLDSCSEPCQPEQLRAAAAEALQLSGMLLPLVQLSVPAAAAGAGSSCTQAAAPGSGADGAVAAVKCSAAGTAVAGGSVATNTVTAAGGDAAASAGSGAAAGGAASLLPALSLRAWLLSLRLMEDEDEEVRQLAAAAAQSALQALPPGHLLQLQQPTVPGSSNSSSPGRLCGGSGQPAVGGVPVRLDKLAPDVTLPGAAQYVAAVQRSCFALLAHCCSWQPGLRADVLQQLAQMVFPADTPVPLLLQQQQQQQQKSATAAAAAASTPGTAAGTAAVHHLPQAHQLSLPGLLLRRLFEREADNHHEEPLLLAQHAAAALRHVLSLLQQQQQQEWDVQQAAAAAANGAGHADDCAVEDVLVTWCTMLAQRFLPAVADALEAASSTGGGGSSSSAGHPEVFVPLYRACLGLWAVQPWLRQQCGRQGTGGLAARAELQQAVGAAAARLAALQHVPNVLEEVVQSLLEEGHGDPDVCRLLFLLN